MRFLIKISFFIIGVICFQAIYAQQHTSYTQYNLNRFSLNPALAGIQPCGEFILGSRRQWVGFEGAPLTYFTSFNTRVNKDDKYPKNFHGYGLNIIGDRYGFSSNFYFKIAYAYNIKLSNNYRASFGMFLGLQRFSQSFSSVRIANKGLDPALNADRQSSYVFPEISPGGFIYNKNLYAGLSMFQIYPERIRTFGSKEHRLSAHYYFIAGYRLRGREWHYIPSLLFNFSPFVSPTADLTLTFDYKQQFSFAFGSKYLNSGYLTLQFRILQSINIGYSYEYALNEINNVAPTTHEFVLSIKNCTIEKKLEKFFCPAYQ